MDGSVWTVTGSGGPSSRSHSRVGPQNGPAQTLVSHGGMAAVGENRQVPASPSAGRDSTDPLARHDHPAGTRIETVNAERSSCSSKQQ